MADAIMTAEGRLINGSLFEKDVYTNEKGKPGTPGYKIEMAFENTDEVIGPLEDALIDACVETWGERGEQMFLDGDIRSPLLDGDVLAQRRAEKGKEGDAYAGFIIIRSDTIYNKHGEDAPGGVYVADENAEELSFDQRGKVFNGSYGIAALKPSTYESDGKKGVKFYLNGYQYTRDGEPLRGSGVAAMFQPLAKPEGEGKGRRRRGK